MAIKVGIVLAIVLAVGYLLFMRAGDINGSDARRLVQSGARLVDVRTREEFAAGHLPGALNIPVQELDRRMGELERQGTAVVLYCRSGNRSGRAARMLKSSGYSAVHDLGAMSRW
jgi:rhodanese-related sulfurtransferase